MATCCWIHRQCWTAATVTHQTHAQTQPDVSGECCVGSPEQFHSCTGETPAVVRETQQYDATLVQVLAKSHASFCCPMIIKRVDPVHLCIPVVLQHVRFQVELAVVDL